MSNPPRYRIRYNLISKHYDLLERPLDRFFEPLRKKAVSLAQGRVLEIGVGTGKTLKYYPKNVELYAIDGSEKMLEVARKKSRELGIKAKFIHSRAEELPFPDNYFDTVISAFTFCTIPEPEKAMKELVRVLKPSGKAVFLEHTKSDSVLLNVLFLRPLKPILWFFLADDPLRETHLLVRGLLEVEREETYYGGIVRLIVAKKMEK